MKTVNAFDPLDLASLMKSSVPSAVSTTESSSPGLPAPSSGVGSSLLGAESAAGLLLILLFAGALLIPFERLIPSERDGKK